MSKLILNEINNIAAEYGGKCLSTEYIPTKELKWMCSKGHTWDSLYSIVKQGGWCPNCMKEEAIRQKHFDSLKAFVEKLGGKCLSDTYENSEVKLKWQCQNGHIFLMTPHIVKQGHWCLECYREEIIKREFTKLQLLAKKKGGKCLSNDYKTDRSRLKWQCKEGHIWYKVVSVVRSGKWCKECKRNDACRQKLKEMKFIAEIKGGLCLSERYENNYTKLIWKCKEGHIWQAVSGNITKKNSTWCPVCSKKLVDEKQKLKRPKPSTEIYQLKAKEFGGILLSEKYIDAETPLKWQCAKGHVWEKSPQSIRSGVWCPLCSEANQKLSIEELQDIATKRNGKLLTKEYIGWAVKMEWQCEKGHIWLANSNQIKSGGWCRKCDIDKRKSSIEDYKKIAESKGGSLISTEYINNITPLEWQCKNGHSWKTKPFTVKQGSWCPVCAKKKL